jgi:hypothetical protein
MVWFATCRTGVHELYQQPQPTINNVSCCVTHYCNRDHRLSKDCQPRKQQNRSLLREEEILIQETLEREREREREKPCVVVAHTYTHTYIHTHTRAPQESSMSIHTSCNHCVTMWWCIIKPSISSLNYCHYDEHLNVRMGLVIITDMLHNSEQLEILVAKLFESLFRIAHQLRYTIFEVAISCWKLWLSRWIRHITLCLVSTCARSTTDAWL